MGEYAIYRGARVKIGTCENMYYLRADQRHRVGPLSGHVNPTNARDLEVIRFRFPWPDEDRVEPGTFDPFERVLGLSGVDVPAEVEHGSVQFVAHAGYNVMLPCPESAAGKASGLTFHRNGHPGPVQFGQQALRNGLWVLIGRCGGCHYPYLAALGAGGGEPAAGRERARVLPDRGRPHPGGLRGAAMTARGSCSERAGASRGARLGVWPTLALLGALAGSAGAGDLTVQEAYPGSRLRPGSDANPYELRQDGRTLGRLEEESPPTRWLVPGSESNPYRVRPRRDAIDDGFDGFGAFDDEGDE